MHRLTLSPSVAQQMQKQAKKERQIESPVSMLIQNKAANSANVAKYSATNQLNSCRTIEENSFSMLFAIVRQSLYSKHFQKLLFFYNFSTLLRYQSDSTYPLACYGLLLYIKISRNDFSISDGDTKPLIPKAKIKLDIISIRIKQLIMS